jgi:hypothetical protein
LWTRAPPAIGAPSEPPSEPERRRSHLQTEPWQEHGTERGPGRSGLRRLDGPDVAGRS